MWATDWDDHVTDVYYKQDFYITGPDDLWHLHLLQDSNFDPVLIRYARKRLVIPIRKRVTHEWNPQTHGMPGGYVDGELILYPVVYAEDWQVSLSGGCWADPVENRYVGIREVVIEKKTETEENIRHGSPLRTYHQLSLKLVRHVLPAAFEVIFRDSAEMPAIHYRDIAKPCDYMGRQLDLISGEVIKKDSVSAKKRR